MTRFPTRDEEIEEFIATYTPTDEDRALFERIAKRLQERETLPKPEAAPDRAPGAAAGEGGGEGEAEARSS